MTDRLKQILKSLEGMDEEVLGEREPLSPCPICSAPRYLYKGITGGILFTCPHKKVLFGDPVEDKTVDDLKDAFNSGKEWDTNGWEWK